MKKLQSKKEIDKSVQITKLLSFAKRELKNKGILNYENVDLYSLKKEAVFILYKKTFNTRCSTDYKKNIHKPQTTKKFKIKYSGKNWNLLRDKILKRDVKCRACSSEENLHCHHSYYMPGRNIWEYPESSFMILCEKCHTEFHEKIKGKDLVIRGENNIKLKIKEEEFLGFYYNKKLIN